MLAIRKHPIWPCVRTYKRQEEGVLFLAITGQVALVNGFRS